MIKGITEAIEFLLRRRLNNYSDCHLLTASVKYVITPSISLTSWKLKSPLLVEPSLLKRMGPVEDQLGFQLLSSDRSK